MCSYRSVVSMEGEFSSLLCYHLGQELKITIKIFK